MTAHMDRAINSINIIFVFILFILTFTYKLRSYLKIRGQITEDRIVCACGEY